MNAGVVALANDGGVLEDTAFPYTRVEHGLELQSTLDLESRLTDLEGFEVTVGTAAQETPNESPSYRIGSDGTVTADNRRVETETAASKVAYVEGEFLVTESQQSEYALDIVDVALNNGSVKQATIDINGFLEAVDDLDPWMAGFYGRDAPVDAGNAFGDYDADANIRDVVAESQLNQLGLQNFIHNGRRMKFRITESGYVEIYRPNDVGTMEFVQFIRSRVLPHVQAE